MENLEIRRFEMFTRLRDFSVPRALLFPLTSRGGQLFAIIIAVIAELEGHAADQMQKIGESREGTITIAVARAALIETLEAINLTARAMALTMPGLEGKFRLPRRRGDQHLLAVARAFVEEAIPLKAEFIARDMPETFIEDLQAEIAALEQAISARNMSTGSKVEATAAIDDAIDRGMRAAQELNAIVQNKLRDDKPALAAWFSARHVERRSGRSEGSTPGTPTPSPEKPPTP